jgi:hypothetical protein
MYRESAVTYSELISDLEKALAWLEGMGISTRTKRHAQYLRTLNKIDKEWQVRGDMRARDVPVESKLMTTAGAEAFQLIRIWRAFAGREPEGLRRKLKTFAGGPPLEGDENPKNSGNSARDIGFELEVAAYFNGVGAVDLTRGVDVVVPFLGMSLFLECKRPSSEAMIAENLDRAGDQIMGELDKTQLASYGIPAISVAKAEWPGGVVLGASRMEQIHGSLQSWTARVDKDYLGPWFRKRTDQRMAAVFVHIPYEAEFEDAPPRPGVQFSMIAGCRPGSGTHNDLVKLKTALGAPD